MEKDVLGDSSDAGLSDFGEDGIAQFVEKGRASASGAVTNHKGDHHR